jgi:hypothetical protein
MINRMLYRASCDDSMLWQSTQLNGYCSIKLHKLVHSDPSNSTITAIHVYLIQLFNILVKNH